MSRFINGFLDLITIWFVSKFGKRPMHFFGLLGTLMFLIGFLSALYIGVMKLLRLYYFHTPTILVTDNPWFYIALTTMIMGVFFFLAGFLGEIIVRTNPDAERYKIAEKTNF
jgi:MFS superfamily sulfate permease-like transporter